MFNVNKPDLSADALWYERAVLMGALSSWMTFGEQHLNPVKLHLF